MYRYEKAETEDSKNHPDDEVYAILDPDGDEIAVVYSEGEAEALVSHLNR